MKLLDFINDKTNNAYKDFKLVSVIFDEKLLLCTFKFLYKDSIDDGAKEQLVKLISEYIGEDVQIIVKCKKAYVDKTLVRDVIFNFITKNFSSLVIDFKKDDIDVVITDDIIVNLYCNQFQKDHIISGQIDKEIIAYANSFFFENFVLNVIHNGNEELSTDIIHVIDVDVSDNSTNQIQYHKLTEITPFVGEVEGIPIHIGTIKSAAENIEVAGELKFLTRKSFESKRKDKEGNTVIKEYFAFSVFDGTGRVNCVYFPTKNDFAMAETLEEGQKVVLHGNIEEFNEKLNFKVKSIAFAEIVKEEIVEEEVERVVEPLEDYVYVRPEPHIDIVQDNLFAEKVDVGQYLMENDVVVFDIETTGLDASKCEIIEIGAVKISKGRIVETFETLIKPTGVIPDEIIDLTGITPEMVVDSPSIKQVMPDFYKFCYGTTIMAYNIDFDYKFISLYGQKQGYIFDNKQIDVLFLARSFVVGLKNFKLSTVCKKLNVSLENAHRAVNDAIATAEVVLKLGPNIT